MAWWAQESVHKRGLRERDQRGAGHDACNCSSPEQQVLPLSCIHCLSMQEDGKEEQSIGAEGGQSEDARHQMWHMDLTFIGN